MSLQILINILENKNRKLQTTVSLSVPNFNKTVVSGFYF